MRLLFLLFPLFLFGKEPANNSFRIEQMKYSRVQEAFAEKSKLVSKTLADHSLSRENLQIYFRAFKTEKILELWGRNSSVAPFELIKIFPICDMSGDVGPKRRSRDLQVPEGFYRISDLNPFSKYYLSLQINYPNASDSIKGARGHLGNFIFIHGECISSGCLAMTTERVKELYVYCVEAFNNGQDDIEITIFPSKFTDNNYRNLMSRFSKDKDKTSLWTDLKKGYDMFELYKLPASVTFLRNGSHEVTEPLPIKNRMMADSIMKCRILTPLKFDNLQGVVQLFPESSPPMLLFPGKQME